MQEKEIKKRNKKRAHRQRIEERPREEQQNKEMAKDGNGSQNFSLLYLFFD